MKKGLYPLLGLVMLLTMAFMPATDIAAPSSQTSSAATSHHTAHFLLHPTQKHTSVKTLQAPHAASSNNNLVYNGGPVMAGTTNVFAIFWQPTNKVSANYQNLIKRFFGAMCGSPSYQN